MTVRQYKSLVIYYLIPWAYQSSQCVSGNKPGCVWTILGALCRLPGALSGKGPGGTREDRLKEAREAGLSSQFGACTHKPTKENCDGESQ